MEKIIIISDIHLSEDEPENTAYTLVKKIAKKEKFDCVINLGDMIDFEYLSSFVEGMPGITEGSRLATDMKTLDTELAFWRKNTKESIFLQGNHCFRLDRFLEKNPLLKGALTTVKEICDKNDTQYIPLTSQPYEYIEGLYISHGVQLSKYCFAQNAERAGKSIITGHSHRGGSYFYRYPDGRVINGTSLGTLGPLDPAYIKTPTRIAGWIQSFGVLYIEGDDWQLDHIVIKDGKSCILNGKKYSLEI